MANLIACPACGNQVSDQAPSCPTCGNPIASESTGVQSIQGTGKELKLQQLFSTLLIGISFAIIMGSVAGEGDPNGAGTAIGSIGTLAGLVWLIVVRFKMWWRHS